MSFTRVFWPKAGLRRNEGLVLGLRVEDVVVVVAIVEKWLDDRARQYPNLTIIGSAGTSFRSGSNSQRFEVILEKGVPSKSSPSAQIILFDPPDPRRLRYLTTGQPMGTNTYSTLAGQEDYGIGSRRESATGLDDILPLLNDVRRLQRELATKYPSSLKGDAQADDWGTFSHLALVFVPLAHFIRLALWASHLPLPFIKNRSISLLSSTVHQLSLRFRQILEGPADFRQTLHKPSVPLHARSQRYMKFWNTVWLILNDLVLGYCASELLKQYGPFLSEIIPNVFQLHMVDWIVSALEWLDDWPVGLKLNTPLSQFFRVGFTTIVVSWGAIVQPALRVYLSALLHVISLSGYGGFTLFLSMVRDTMALLTLHLRICHEVTSLLVRWQLSSLGGLWNLFRGKKWNVLRQRTDSYAYDVDQLFLGTLLFTVTAFLLPTVVTYAALFASIRSGFWTVDKVLEVMTNALNAFPLFEVLLRIKEPSRLPHGVVFKLKSIGKGGLTSVLELKNAPRPLSSILLRSNRTSHKA